VARTTPPGLVLRGRTTGPAGGAGRPWPVRFPPPARPPREGRPAIRIVPDKGAVLGILRPES